MDTRSQAAARATRTLPWLLLGVLYFPVFRVLYKSRWEYIDYTHAYFILPVALFIVWTTRKSLAAAMPRAEKLGRSDLPWLVMTAASLAAFIFSYRQDYLFLEALLLIPLSAGLLGFLYGPKTLKILRFPLLYLLFLVPPPLGVLDSLTLPMRRAVSALTEGILQSVGYPITREGLLLSIGGHEVYLGEACSGFRSLITLASLGLAYIYFSNVSRRRKTAMALSIIPLALTGNLLRVVSVVLVTHYLGVTRGQAFFHDFSGFALFLILVAGLLAVERFPAKQRASHAD